MSLDGHVRIAFSSNGICDSQSHSLLPFYTKCSSSIVLTPVPGDVALRWHPWISPYPTSDGYQLTAPQKTGSVFFHLTFCSFGTVGHLNNGLSFMKLVVISIHFVFSYLHLSCTFSCIDANHEGRCFTYKFIDGNDVYRTYMIFLSVFGW